MKTIILVILALMLRSACAQSVPPQLHPSQLVSSSKKFLLTTRSDLRLFVCDKVFLDDRIRRKVCLVNFITPSTTNAPQILECPGLASIWWTGSECMRHGYF